MAERAASGGLQPGGGEQPESPVAEATTPASSVTSSRVGKCILQPLVEMVAGGCACRRPTRRRPPPPAVFVPAFETGNTQMFVTCVTLWQVLFSLMVVGKPNAPLSCPCTPPTGGRPPAAPAAAQEPEHHRAVWRAGASGAGAAAAARQRRRQQRRRRRDVPRNGGGQRLAGARPQQHCCHPACIMTSTPRCSHPFLHCWTPRLTSPPPWMPLPSLLSPPPTPPPPPLRAAAPNRGGQPPAGVGLQRPRRALAVAGQRGRAGQRAHGRRQLPDQVDRVAGCGGGHGGRECGALVLAPLGEGGRRQG